jgi:hypothetical protein
MLSSRALMAAVAICTIGGVAQAGSGSPHFVTGPTASIDSTTGDLVVNWKEAGLGNTPIEYDLVVQTVDFTWQCFTKSGNKPQGSPNSGGRKSGVYLNHHNTPQRKHYRHFGSWTAVATPECGLPREGPEIVPDSRLVHRGHVRRRDRRTGCHWYRERANRRKRRRANPHS